MGDSLRSQSSKGKVGIRYLRTVETQGQQIVSAFGIAGWQVQTMQVGMGASVGSAVFSEPVVLVGQSNNEAVAAARKAFTDAGIEFTFEQGQPIAGPASISAGTDLAIDKT